MRGISSAPRDAPEESPKSRLLLLAQMAEVRAMLLFGLFCFLTYLLCFHGPRLQSHPWHIFIFVGFACCVVRYTGAGAVCCNQYLLPQRLAIVTGANSGIGLATTIALIKLRVSVIMAVRDVKKAEEAVETIRKELGIKDRETMNKVLRVMELDLTSFESIRSFVVKLAELMQVLRMPVHILVNNAGALLSRHGYAKTSSSEDFFGEDAVEGLTTTSASTVKSSSSSTSSSSAGSARSPSKAGSAASKVSDALVENTFATNYLGHFLLTALLFPLLAKSATRVINLTSAFHMSVKANVPVHEMNMVDKKTWDGPTAYARSKLCNIWFTRSLQRRFDACGSQAQAFAVHPGTVWSPFHLPFYRDSPCGIFMLFPLIMAPMSWLSMKSPLEGAQTTLHCIFGQKVNPGQHYAECSVAATSPVAQDDDKAEELWKYSLELVGLTEKVLTRHAPAHGIAEEEEGEEEADEEGHSRVGSNNNNNSTDVPESKSARSTPVAQKQRPATTTDTANNSARARKTATAVTAGTPSSASSTSTPMVARASQQQQQTPQQQQQQAAGQGRTAGSGVRKGKVVTVQG